MLLAFSDNKRAIGELYIERASSHIMGYYRVIFLTLVQSIGAEQVGSSQTAEELRYPLMIVHNIVIRVHE